MRTVTTGRSTGWMTSARWRSADARAALRALEESGEPVARFAARHGIGAHRLYEWRRRLSNATATGAGTTASSPAVEVPVFVEVEPPMVGRARGDEVFEVVLTTGDVVRVPQHFDEPALRRVLAALRGGSSC